MEQVINRCITIIKVIAWLSLSVVSSYSQPPVILTTFSIVLSANAPSIHSPSDRHPLRPPPRAASCDYERFQLSMSLSSPSQTSQLLHSGLIPFLPFQNLPLMPWMQHSPSSSYASLDLHHRRFQNPKRPSLRRSAGASSVYAFLWFSQVVQVKVLVQRMASRSFQRFEIVQQQHFEFQLFVWRQAQPFDPLRPIRRRVSFSCWLSLCLFRRWTVQQRLGWAEGGLDFEYHWLGIVIALFE